jgi:gliding motility-associated-like protein
MQACPVNINFSSGTLTHWFGYTGNNKNGNGADAIKQTYDSTAASPAGTIGATEIEEYNLPSVAGIQTITKPGTDPFGNFPTIPTINGYAYDYSILLGSTSISRGSGTQGGYIRGVSYKISVPQSAIVQPYTMTYAYAMVLENGSHNTNQQPLFTANLNTASGTISCADASYLLPTLNNAGTGGGNATLDENAARKEGFSLSTKPSPNNNGNSNESQYRVWTKGWTEVTFDLSPYRGQQVTLTFEADNCIPGGHFAYAYIALRNTCDGLMISGDTLACTNSTMTYSIPSLGGASYEWSVPGDWQITSDTTNIITVKAGKLNGPIIAREQNSCADLRDTIMVTTTLPSIGGQVTGNNIVCEGINTSNLAVSGNNGNVIQWLSSADGVSWDPITDTTLHYTANNLVNTTLYKALVQNGAICIPDTSSAATVTVDQKSVGGSIYPPATTICEGQNKDAPLTVTGNTGQILNWQSSQDTLHWTDFNPAYTDTNYNITGITMPTQYRAIIKNGVCEADTGNYATVAIYPALYPQAVNYPADTTICFGTIVQLNANILIGSSYTWPAYGSVDYQGDGTISSLPSTISALAAPSQTTDYILNILNKNCPIPLKDTFHIVVNPPVIVNAGQDTSIVAGQPLQLQASVNNSTEDYSWLWLPPATGLNDPDIANPIALLSSAVDSVRYLVKATDTKGCYGTDDIVVYVYKTAPEIFVPSAFTPNGDGKNDVIRPVTVGITQLEYFRIYNRWGQLLYSTGEVGQGWDGTLNGTRQPSGTYVYMARGTDYRGNAVSRKGTVVLIR